MSPRCEYMMFTNWQYLRILVISMIHKKMFLMDLMEDGKYWNNYCASSCSKGLFLEISSLRSNIKNMDYLKSLNEYSNKNDTIISDTDYAYVYNVLIYRWQLNIIKCLSKQCYFIHFLWMLCDFMFDFDMEDYITSSESKVCRFQLNNHWMIFMHLPVHTITN